MGISTVTAGRIRKGQLKGQNGEDEVTFMESLPHLALSKVTKYCINNLKVVYYLFGQNSLLIIL